jgi:cell shape-determining protein MreC
MNREVKRFSATSFPTIILFQVYFSLPPSDAASFFFKMSFSQIFLLRFVALVLLLSLLPSPEFDLQVLVWLGELYLLILVVLRPVAASSFHQLFELFQLLLSNRKLRL